MSSDLLLKYEDLLKPLIGNKGIRYDKKGLSNLIFNFKEDKTQTTFALFETENQVFVTWAQKNEKFGQRGKEWCFSQNSSQEKMFLTIRKDLDEYLNHLRN